MKYKLTDLLLAFTMFHVCVGHGLCQITTDFEDIGLAKDTFWNDAGPQKGFYSKDIILPNAYDASFNFWSGWSISSKTNGEIGGFINQYASKPGSGTEESLTYAVGYLSGGITIKFKEGVRGIFQSLNYTNSAYTYWSMKEGDAFAKKFGGPSGHEKDYYCVSVRAFDHGRLSEDSLVFYLADYRFEDNDNDYIIEDWHELQLSELGLCDSLLLTPYSSDIGQFGINTPTYICVDNVRYEKTSSTSSDTHRQISVFPNPVTQAFQLNIDSPAWYCIQSPSGQWIRQGFYHPNDMINLHGLRAGIYTISIRSKDGIYYSKISKVN